MQQSPQKPGADALSDLLTSQRESFSKSAFVGAGIREDRLDRLLDALIRYEHKICDALMADYGYRSVDQSRFAEVVTSCKPIKTARRNVRKWMKQERRKTGFPFNMAGARAYVQYQPLGVIGIISPWNFPVNLTVVPLAGVLAAGNTALIKPSEQTPATAEMLAELIGENFDSTEVSVVTGGPEIGAAFSKLPFDHLIYTGGENVARHIMRAAAENLVPLTLELGGKSPVVIGTGANLKQAAEKIMFGKVFNAGQICLAPDYALVPENILEPFINAMQSAADKTFHSDRGHKDYVSVINGHHAGRIRAYISEAGSKGARIVSLGPQVHADAGNENIVPVTMIIDPPERCSIVHEEIFGPILIVRTYNKIDEAITQINSAPKPLALYYFGKPSVDRQRVLNETTSGGVTLNDVIMHYTIDDLPFGGVGNSGMGAYHGFDGFKQFSHARSVYRQSPFDIGRPLRPPYGKAFRTVSNLLMKIN